MFNYKLFIRIFSILNVIIGACSILFLFTAPYLIPGITEIPLMSSVFFIALSFPLLVGIMGTMSLTRATWSPTFSIFCTFFILINSLGSLLSKDPPFFVTPDAPEILRSVFHTIIPVASLVYFGLYLGLTYLQVRGAKKEPPKVEPEDLLQHREFSCAQCGQLLKESDSVCQKCGALIKGVKCPDCGFEGKAEDFVEGRCPRCGSRGNSEQKV